MQLFAKLKKICEGGFRATLNFQKVKVALNLLRKVLKSTEKMFSVTLSNIEQLVSGKLKNTTCMGHVESWL